MADPFLLERLETAYKTVRADLLDLLEPAGHWVGELSSSALSTATALSALAIVRRRREVAPQGLTDDASRYDELILPGIRWLARQQNDDGGWGDTDRSSSNIATTMLVRAAFQLNCVPAEPANLIERADAYIEKQGGIRGLRRRYGRDKTFAVPILTNCALAGMVDWRDVSPLPFELACLPQSTYRLLRLPVVSYAIPALVAIGLARFQHAPPLNPIMRGLRKACKNKSLSVLEAIQPTSGGFLEAAPLTSFVVMSLASCGLERHPVTQAGLEFLVDSVRPDGSWPIDTNLATWLTTLSVNALSAGQEDVWSHVSPDWILQCQNTEIHPYTGAAPGGWAWTDLSGGVPDADDTAGAMLAIYSLAKDKKEGDQSGAAGPKVHEAASSGVEWLLDVQNRDGGWPTFCRGWGKLPFDRSGTDLTAHAMRALHVWRPRLADGAKGSPSADRQRRIGAAIERGFEYLKRQQRADGSWVPLWFGNEHQEEEVNPIYGTARVLLAYRDLDRAESPEARRGYDWLLSAQDLGGGWGGSGRHLEKGLPYRESSVEEASLALEALLSDPRMQSAASLQHMVKKGLAWLADAIERNQHHEATPIGFYFAKLWYYEKLYPLIFATSALAEAIRSLAEPPSHGSHRTARTDSLAPAPNP